MIVFVVELCKIVLMIDPSAHIILIPWDHLFNDPFKRRHVITVTTTMGTALGIAITQKQGICHKDRVVNLCCFYDECLLYGDAELEKTYEVAKDEVLEMVYKTNHQQWLFGNHFLLKGFKQFFNPYDGNNIQYLEPATIEAPFILFITDTDKLLQFSTPLSHESIICLQ